MRRHLEQVKIPGHNQISPGRKSCSDNHVIVGIGGDSLCGPGAHHHGQQRIAIDDAVDSQAGSSDLPLESALFKNAREFFQETRAREELNALLTRGIEELPWRTVPQKGGNDNIRIQH